MVVSWCFFVCRFPNMQGQFLLIEMLDILLNWNSGRVDYGAEQKAGIYKEWYILIQDRNVKQSKLVERALGTQNPLYFFVPLLVIISCPLAKPVRRYLFIFFRSSPLQSSWEKYITWKDSLQQAQSESYEENLLLIRFWHITPCVYSYDGIISRFGWGRGCGMGLVNLRY